MTTPAGYSNEELAVLARSMPRGLTGWGRTSLSDDVAALADEAARGGEPDRYGAGGVVAEVEEQVRALLGAPAALLCPSGTLAQQVALRGASLDVAPAEGAALLADVVRRLA